MTRCRVVSAILSVDVYKRQEEDNGDALFQTIISTQDKTQTWPLLMMYITEQQEKFMTYAEEKYRDITSAFITESSGVLSKTESSLSLIHI